MLMRFKLLIFAMVCVAGCVTAMSQTVAGMAERADRFFHYREWASAGALYAVLIGDHSDSTRFYGRGIVAAGMLGDTLQQTQLTNIALESHVAIDSLFTSVERTSFSIGQTSLYEDFLLATKVDKPWLSRVVDSYLMRYYTYRRDARGMIEYSRIMLEGNPDDERFLYTLAQGYLIGGQIDEALATYNRIVELNPQAYEALLYLANYYNERAAADRVAADKAADYFRRARAIKSTPYVEQQLKRIRKMKGLFR